MCMGCELQRPQQLLAAHMTRPNPANLHCADCISVTHVQLASGCSWQVTHTCQHSRCTRQQHNVLTLYDFH
jgi:hypothetical protein